MKETDIKKIVEEQGSSFCEHATIYASIVSGIAAYRLGLGEVMHIMKDHILHFTSGNILIFPIDDHTGRVLNDRMIKLCKTDIKEIHIKVGFFRYRMYIETNQGTIEYIIRKNILGSPWHKLNLSFLLLQVTQQVVKTQHKNR